MKIAYHSDWQAAATAQEGLKRMGGCRPCRTQRTQENKCMCQAFRDRIKDLDFAGFCHRTLSNKSLWEQTRRSDAIMKGVCKPKTKKRKEHTNAERDANMTELKITKNNFTQEVLSSDKPVLVDFWASWCGPCKMLAPVLHEIAQEYEGSVKIGKINVDEEPELAGQFRVSSIPMLVLFKNGEAVSTMVGYRPKAQIAEMLR